MGKLKVAAFSVSIDGFGAGVRQDLQNPLGVRGFELHEWFFPTRTFQAMQGKDGGATSGADAEMAAASMAGMGAWIMGRNMFGPIRGSWPDGEWKGWWGEEPPYHVPTFVLTHHARAPIEMKGGTVFHFVTGGIHEALERARAVAGDKDIRVGGGVSTIRQYVKAQLLDELHLAVVPVVLGQGEALFAGVDWAALGYKVAESRRGENAQHIVIRR